MDSRKIMYGVVGAAAFIFGGLVTRSKVLDGLEVVEVKYLGREPINPPPAEH